MMRRLLVLEDERLVAAMMSDILRRAGFDVAVAHDALRAIEMADEFDPDGAIIDVHLGSGPNGIDVGRRLNITHPEMRLIFLSRFGIPSAANPKEPSIPPRSSFISKETIDDPDQLVDVIEQALRNSSFTRVVQSSDNHPIQSLTFTQLSILRLAAQGLTNQAIAQTHGTAVRNVEQLLKRSYETLRIEASSDTNPRVEAIRQYIASFGIPTQSKADSIDI